MGSTAAGGTGTTDDGGGTATVSVVVPTKNRTRRLMRTLAFIRRQTHENLQIIVSDDGSTDGTAEHVAELGDDRIEVVRSEQSTGVSGARNRGIAAATGSHIAFCDDDDLWLAPKISRQLDALTASAAAWATCGAVHTKDDLAPVHSSKFPTQQTIRDQIGHINPIPGGCSSVLVRSDALATVGGFDGNLSMFADWDMWLRLFLEHGQPAVVDEYLVLYMVHDGQMTRQMTALTSELDHFRTKHGDARRQLGTPRVDGVDWWVVQSLRAAGRWWDAARYVVTDANSRSPLALRELRRPLFKRHRPQPFAAVTPEQQREEALVQAACRAGREVLAADPVGTAL